MEDLTQAEEALSHPEEEQDIKRAKIAALLKEAEEQSALKRDLEDELKETVAPIKQIERSLDSLKKRRNAAAKQVKAAKQRLQQARDEIIARADSAVRIVLNWCNITRAWLQPSDLTSFRFVRSRKKRGAQLC